MANDQLAPWDLADGDGTNNPQPDPNASLKGKRSVTRVADELLGLTTDYSTVTSVVSDNVVRDSTQVFGAGELPDPASGDDRRPDEDSGDYESSSTLLHWWRLGYDPDNVPSFVGLTGRDEVGSQPLTVAAVSNLDTGAFANPGTMWNQRASPFFSAGRMRTSADQTWPISTQFSFAGWIRSFDLSFQNDAQMFFAITDTGSGFAAADTIQLYVGRRTAGSDLLNTGTIWVNVHDNGGTEFSARTTNAITLFAWTHVAVTCDLNAGTMEIYLDGVAETLANETTPSSLSMGLSTQAGRKPYVGSFEPQGSFSFRGQIHSACLWNTILTADEVADLAGFGDGPDPGSPPLDYTNKWMTFHGPTNLNEVREVVAFDDSTGEYTLDSDLPSTPQVGDFYRLWGPNGFFSPYDNDQSVRRPFKHRLTYFRNETAAQLNVARLYVKDIIPGPLVCEVACGVRTGGDVFVVGVDNEEDTPDILTLAGGFLQGDLKPQTFEKPFNYAQAGNTTPRGRDQSVGVNAGIQAFIRLSFRDNEPIPIGTRCVFQVFSDFNNGQTIGCLLIVVDVLGADEELILGPDRKLRIAAGARVQAIVRDRATKALIPNHTVNITLEAPSPGSLGPQNKEVTDETGIPVAAVYLSPTDGGEEGEDVTFTIEVN